MIVSTDQLGYGIQIIFRIALLRLITTMEHSVHTWPELTREEEPETCGSHTMLADGFKWTWDRCTLSMR